MNTKALQRMEREEVEEELSFERKVAQMRDFIREECAARMDR